MRLTWHTQVDDLQMFACLTTWISAAKRHVTRIHHTLSAALTTVTRIQLDITVCPIHVHDIGDTIKSLDVRVWCVSA